MITSRQIRAARGLLGWDSVELAQKAGLTKEALCRIEGNKVRPHESTLSKLARALADAGVVFTAHEGVHLRPNGVETLTGQAGLDQLQNALNAFLNGSREPVYVRTSKAQGFPEKLGRMIGVGKDKRVLALLDQAPTASHPAIEYRWSQRQEGAEPTFCVFGDMCVQIIEHYETAPLVLFITSPTFAEAMRQSLRTAWTKGFIPPR